MIEVNKLVQKISKDPKSIISIDWAEETNWFDTDRLEEIILSIDNDKLNSIIRKYISYIWYDSISKVKWVVEIYGKDYALDRPSEERLFNFLKNDIDEFYFKPRFISDKDDELEYHNNVLIEEFLEKINNIRLKIRENENNINDLKSSILNETYEISDNNLNKVKRGRKKGILFGDNQQKYADIFVIFLKQAHRYSTEVDTSESNYVNKAFRAFYTIVNKSSGKINGNACYNFIKDNCQLNFSVQPKSYSEFLRQFLFKDIDKNDDLYLKMYVHLKENGIL